jgi:hypothetical protein
MGSFPAARQQAHRGSPPPARLTIHASHADRREAWGVRCRTSNLPVVTPGLRHTERIAPLSKSNFRASSNTDRRSAKSRTWLRLPRRHLDRRRTRESRRHRNSRHRRLARRGDWEWLPHPWRPLALRSLWTLGALSPLGTGRALRAGYSLNSLRSLGARRTLWTRIALGAGVAATSSQGNGTTYSDSRSPLHSRPPGISHDISRP